MTNEKGQLSERELNYRRIFLTLSFVSYRGINWFTLRDESKIDSTDELIQGGIKWSIKWDLDFQLYAR